MENQIIFIKYITIVGSYLGISLGLLLLFVKSRQFKSNVFLGFVVMLFTLYFIPPTFAHLGILEDFPHVVQISLPVVFLMGPTMLFYVRACTEKDFKFTPAMWLHYVPALLDIAYHIPVFAMSGAEKLALFDQMFNQGELRDAPIILIVRWIHAVVYSVITIRVVYLYRKNVLNTASYIDVDFHRWLLLFCSFLLLPRLALSIFAFSNLKTTALALVGITIFAFINCVYAAIFLKPQLFHALPHQMVNQTAEETAKQKYESSNLRDTQKSKLVEKLVAYVESEKPYQESELTIADLADQVNIQPHYLSQIINQNLKCNFLDFINGYRVEAAKSMLRDEKYEHYTILSIAYEAGFNSKTAFYNAFKKNTGTTPSQFKKSLVLQVP